MADIIKDFFDHITQMFHFHFKNEIWLLCIIYYAGINKSLSNPIDPYIYPYDLQLCSDLLLYILASGLGERLIYQGF